MKRFQCPNNTWVNATESRCVIVFVHEILSDSGAWQNKKANTFWPQMLVEDRQFENPSVFVSGYTAGLGAGLFTRCPGGSRRGPGPFAQSSNAASTLG